MTDTSHSRQSSTLHQCRSRSSPVMFRPTKPEDWEGYRDVIAELYNTQKMTLKDVMAEMQISHGFKATEKQYKTQIKKWNLDTKYIKASEYMAMIKTKREREQEDPPKETQFILRGRVVDPKDITRFEKRAQKKGTAIPTDDDYDQEAIEDLRYVTPPPEDTQYSYGEAEASSSQYTTAPYSSSQYLGTQYDASGYYTTAQYGSSQYNQNGYNDQYDGQYYSYQ